jgi:hypothetical protein
VRASDMMQLGGDYAVWVRKKKEKSQVWVGLFSSSERIEFDNPDRDRGSREYLVGEFEGVPAGTKVEPKQVVFIGLPVDETKHLPHLSYQCWWDEETQRRLSLPTPAPCLRWITSSRGRPGRPGLAGMVPAR